MWPTATGPRENDLQSKPSHRERPVDNSGTYRLGDDVIECSKQIRYRKLYAMVIVNNIHLCPVKLSEPVLKTTHPKSKYESFTVAMNIRQEHKYK